MDSPGDNLLAEFVSVVDAVQCGVSVQKEIKARNSTFTYKGTPVKVQQVADDFEARRLAEEASALDPEDGAAYLLLG